MSVRRVVLLGISVGFAGAAHAQDAPAPQKPVVYIGRAFVFEADVARARELAWIAADVSDDQALDGVATTLTRRMRGAARFPEAQIEREKNGRFSVTVVGPHAASIEKWLIAGCSSPGRLEFRVVARDADFGALGTTAAEEGARLRRWRAAHEDTPLTEFDAVPRDQGGPHQGLTWRLRRGGADDSPPAALLRAPLHRVVREDMEEGLRVVRESRAAVQVGFEFTLTESGAAALAAFSTGLIGREVAFAVNDEIAFTTEVVKPLGPKVVVDGGFKLDEWRVLVFAVSGGPLDVPLRFVERSQRELKNVKRGEPQKRR